MYFQKGKWTKAHLTDYVRDLIEAEVKFRLVKDSYGVNVLSELDDESENDYISSSKKELNTNFIRN